MKYVPPIWETGDSTDPNRPYLDADPGSGIKGSIPSAVGFEHTQREILAVITGAGLTPNEAVLDQLYTAITTIIAGTASPDASETVKGKVELATATEALGGTDTTRAVTSAGLASSKSISGNGYYKLPGGLILQWGSQSITTSSTTYNFPIAFPNACLSMAVSISNNTSVNIALTATSASGYTVNVGTGTTTLRYFAIGY